MIADMADPPIPHRSTTTYKTLTAAVHQMSEFFSAPCAFHSFYLALTPSLQWSWWWVGNCLFNCNPPPLLALSLSACADMRSFLLRHRYPWAALITISPLTTAERRGQLHDLLVDREHPTGRTPLLDHTSALGLSGVYDIRRRASSQAPMTAPTTNTSNAPDGKEVATHTGVPDVVSNVLAQGDDVFGECSSSIIMPTAELMPRVVANTSLQMQHLIAAYRTTSGVQRKDVVSNFALAVVPALSMHSVAAVAVTKDTAPGGDIRTTTVAKEETAGVSRSPGASLFSFATMGLLWIARQQWSSILKLIEEGEQEALPAVATPDSAPSSGGGTTAAPPIKDNSQLEARVRRFYDAYAPENKALIPGLLTQFQGRDEKLISLLIAKYGPEPSCPLPNPPSAELTTGERTDDGAAMATKRRRAARRATVLAEIVGEAWSVWHLRAMTNATAAREEDPVEHTTLLLLLEAIAQMRIPVDDAVEMGSTIPDPSGGSVARVGGTARHTSSDVTHYHVRLLVALRRIRDDTRDFVRSGNVATLVRETISRGHVGEGPPDVAPPFFSHGCATTSSGLLAEYVNGLLRLPISWLPPVTETWSTLVQTIAILDAELQSRYHRATAVTPGDVISTPIDASVEIRTWFALLERLSAPLIRDWMPTDNSAEEGLGTDGTASQWRLLFSAVYFSDNARCLPELTSCASPADYRDRVRTRLHQLVTLVSEFDKSPTPSDIRAALTYPVRQSFRATQPFVCLAAIWDVAASGESTSSTVVDITPLPRRLTKWLNIDIVALQLLTTLCAPPAGAPASPPAGPDSASSRSGVACSPTAGLCGRLWSTDALNSFAAELGVDATRPPWLRFTLTGAVPRGGSDEGLGALLLPYLLMKSAIRMRLAKCALVLRNKWLQRVKSGAPDVTPGILLVCIRETERTLAAARDVRFPPEPMSFRLLGSISTSDMIMSGVYSCVPALITLFISRQAQLPSTDLSSRWGAPMLALSATCDDKVESLAKNSCRQRLVSHLLTWHWPGGMKRAGDEAGQQQAPTEEDGRSAERINSLTMHLKAFVLSRSDFLSRQPVGDIVTRCEAILKDYARRCASEATAASSVAAAPGIASPEHTLVHLMGTTATGVQSESVERDLLPMLRVFLQHEGFINATTDTPNTTMTNMSEGTTSGGGVSAVAWVFHAFALGIVSLEEFLRVLPRSIVTPPRSDDEEEQRTPTSEIDLDDVVSCDVVAIGVRSLGLCAARIRHHVRRTPEAAEASPIVSHLPPLLRWLNQGILLAACPPGNADALLPQTAIALSRYTSVLESATDVCILVQAVDANVASRIAADCQASRLAGEDPASASRGWEASYNGDTELLNACLRAMLRLTTSVLDPTTDSPAGASAAGGTDLVTPSHTGVGNHHSSRPYQSTRFRYMAPALGHLASLRERLRSLRRLHIPDDAKIDVLSSGLTRVDSAGAVRLARRFSEGGERSSQSCLQLLAFVIAFRCADQQILFELRNSIIRLSRSSGIPILWLQRVAGILVRGAGGGAANATDLSTRCAAAAAVTATNAYSIHRAHALQTLTFDCLSVIITELSERATGSGAISADDVTDVALSTEQVPRVASDHNHNPGNEEQESEPTATTPTATLTEGVDEATDNANAVGDRTLLSSIRAASEMQLLRTSSSLRSLLQLVRDVFIMEAATRPAGQLYLEDLQGAGGDLGPASGSFHVSLHNAAMLLSRQLMSNTDAAPALATNLGGCDSPVDEMQDEVDDVTVCVATLVSVSCVLNAHFRRLVGELLVSWSRLIGIGAADMAALVAEGSRADLACSPRGGTNIVAVTTVDAGTVDGAASRLQRASRIASQVSTVASAFASARSTGRAPPSSQLEGDHSLYVNASECVLLPFLRALIGSSAWIALFRDLPNPSSLDGNTTGNVTLQSSCRHRLLEHVEMLSNSLSVVFPCDEALWSRIRDAHLQGGWPVKSDDALAGAFRQACVAPLLAPSH